MPEKPSLPTDPPHPHCPTCHGRGSIDDGSIGGRDTPCPTCYPSYYEKLDAWKMAQVVAYLDAHPPEVYACGTWYPIESAPRNGTTQILVYSPSDDPEDRIFMVTYARDGFGHPDGWSNGRDWRIVLDGQCVKATYWMPLPEPPRN